MLASIATRNSLVEVNSWFIGKIFYKIFHIPLALNEVKWPFSEIYKESPHCFCQFIAMMWRVYLLYIHKSLNTKNS